jgi:hypothetical protein
VFLNFSTVHLIWTFIYLIFLISDIFLIWKIFSKTHELTGLLFASTIILMMPITRTVIFIEQTTFIAVFFVLLFYRDIKSVQSGVLIALEFFIKPFVGILFLFYVIHRL